MLEQTEALRARCRAFAIRTVRFARQLPRDPGSDTLARQLARAGSGASGNYHSACRARSRAEFISRLRLAVDEADESWHWLTVIQRSDVASGPELQWLLQESIELRAIFSKSVSTAKSNSGT
jgi:four helix bundle protein